MPKSTPVPVPVSPEWWRTAVIYQVYPRSFADASGDGIGDLPGITSRLGHLADLGVDAVWLSPFYVSPQNDAGYDVADYCDVDPLFGTLDDADALIARAHELGLRVIFDVVPNHSSSEHRWFKEALAAGPGSPKRDRYIFREGRGPEGAEPPNNWLSMFGGPAWTRITEADGTPGPWYLHIFHSTQPDFDWTNPWVADQFDDVLRRWRRVADEYEGDRALVAEAWVLPLSKMAKWVRPDELHQAFNFGYLMTRWDAKAMRAVIDESLAAFASVGAPSTWVLSNHDTVRHPSRLSLKGVMPHNIGVGPESPD